MLHNPIIKSLLLIVMLAVSISAPGFTVVIDPGHGGKDAGALGNFTNEKSVNLGVALQLGRLLKKGMPDAKAIFTRDKDVFVTLQGRADIANKSKGDLFISIHANSVPKNSPRRNSVSGASVYTLGLERSATNLEIAKRENAVIMLEKDYSTTYKGFDPNSTESYIMFEMFQSSHLDRSIKFASVVQKELVSTAGRKNNGVRQAPFYVLVRTAMPSVLVELDFICNPTQEKFMASEDGQKKLAMSIYNAITRYRGITDSATLFPHEDHHPSKDTSSVKTAENKTRLEKSTTVVDNTLYYRIQFLTSTKTLKGSDQRLKGLKPIDSYREDGIVKYTYGNTSSLTEAKRQLSEIKKLFPQAFIIKWRNGKRIK